MDKIAVLIPCFNESKTIEKVVKDFKKVFELSKKLQEKHYKEIYDELSKSNKKIGTFEEFIERERQEINKEIEKVLIENEDSEDSDDLFTMSDEDMEDVDSELYDEDEFFDE